MPQGETLFDLERGIVTYPNTVTMTMSGPLSDFCRSIYINADVDCILIFDRKTQAGKTIESNGKYNLVGLPIKKFSIICTQNTQIELICSIYPRRIVAESIEHYENYQPIRYTINVMNVNETIITFNQPVTFIYILTGVAPFRMAFDRAANAITDPLLPAGTVINLPLKINATIQAIGVGGLTTFDGWGLY